MRVAHEKDLPALFAAADECGTLGALVNNAGIVGKSGVRVDEMSAERIQQMRRSIVTGSFLCAREAVKRMSRIHGGKGGVTVTVLGRGQAWRADHYVDYAASKGAVDLFTIGLAMKSRPRAFASRRPAWADGHRNSCQRRRARRAHRLSHMVPMKRVGTAEEIANAIVSGRRRTKPPDVTRQF